MKKKMISLTLTSDGTDKEEELKIERALKSDSAFYILSSIMDLLREIIKHEENSDETYERFWKFREEVVDLMDRKGINLDYYYN